LSELKQHCLNRKELPLKAYFMGRSQWGTFYLLIANFFATQNIGGAKELVVLL
jgi:hypothetical protein